MSKFIKSQVIYEPVWLLHFEILNLLRGSVKSVHTYTRMKIIFVMKTQNSKVFPVDENVYTHILFVYVLACVYKKVRHAHYQETKPVLLQAARDSIWVKVKLSHRFVGNKGWPKSWYRVVYLFLYWRDMLQ